MNASLRVQPKLEKGVHGEMEDARSGRLLPDDPELELLHLVIVASPVVHPEPDLGVGPTQVEVPDAAQLMQVHQLLVGPVLGPVHHVGALALLREHCCQVDEAVHIPVHGGVPELEDHLLAGKGEVLDGCGPGAQVGRELHDLPVISEPDLEGGVLHQDHDEIPAEDEVRDAAVGHDDVLQELGLQSAAELLVDADGVGVEGVEVGVDAGESQAGPVVAQEGSRGAGIDPGGRYHPIRRILKL